MKNEKRGGEGGEENPAVFWPCSESTIVSHRPTQTLGTQVEVKNDGDGDGDDMGGSHINCLNL